MEKTALKCYRLWRREIEALTEEIDGFQTRDTVLSAAEFPYRRHAVTVYGRPAHDEACLGKIQKRAGLAGKCREVERFVSGIPDPITRRVFELRHLEGAAEPTWRDIAAEIYGSENSIKQRACRYLKEVTHVTN